MRTFLCISSLFFATILKGQGIDKSYLDKWIKLADSTFAVDSVRVYFVNGHYLSSFDTLELSTQLKMILPNRISCIGFSEFKSCGYQPGVGTIFVNSIKYQDSNDIKHNLTAAKKIFIDNYISFSQHYSNNAKDPVLMIDYIMIHHTEVKDALNKLKYQELYSIDINPYPVPGIYFGPNSRNGLVQVLTKKKVAK
jgi:hypothetical protein